MTPQALMFTILFIADDPLGASVVIDVVEDNGGRSVDVVVLPADRPPLASKLRSAPAPLAAKERGLRRWPLVPAGSALTPVVDGAILTIDDVGLWQDPPVPSVAPTVALRPKPPKTPIRSSMVAPELPVAGPTTLRLFLSAILDDASAAAPLVPVPASLHGSRTRVAGTALVLRRPMPVVGLSVAHGEAEGGPALVALSLPGGCAPVPTKVVQSLTSLTSTTTTCTSRLAVSRARGVRYGDKADKDADANGVVVVRLP